MGDYNSSRSHHDFMSFSIYSFLDSLLYPLQTSETLENESSNRDEITTKVQAGGYSEDIFIFLSDREKEEYCCSVCYSIVKDAHQCRNGHKFCYNCVYVWSTCNRTGADLCPVCRCDGVYARNDQLNDKINRKRVKCVLQDCNWRGFLRDFDDHDHRIYEFRELNTSSELPPIKGKEQSNSETTKLDSIDNVKSDDLIEETNINLPLNSSNIENKIDGETSSIINSNLPRVTRTSLAPRRLRGNETTSSGSRTSILRPTIMNSRPNITTRCPAYRHNVTTPLLASLPRTSVHGNVSNQDSNSNVSDNFTGQSEYIQTNTIDSPESIFEPILTNQRESPRESMDSPIRSPYIRSRRVVHLPAIDQTTLAHLPIERSEMEYRRLAPTYASRRGTFGIIPNEGREQLAMMLILLTSDLEDRATINERPVEPTTNNGPITTESNTSIIENTSPHQNHTNIRLGRSRLQEFRNLNRRLSEVANSLDRLIDSTRIEGERRPTTFNDNTESSTSDIDEEFNNRIYH